MPEFYNPRIIVVSHDVQQLGMLFYQGSPIAGLTTTRYSGI